MDPAIFASNLKSLRSLQKLTQTEIAKRLFVTPQTVSKWENGTAVPDVANLCRLAELLHTTPNGLLGIGTSREGIAYLGIDGGGSKTDLVLFLADGTVVKQKTVGACNPNSVGLARAVELLSDAIEQITLGFAVGGIFAGIAGAAAANNMEEMSAALKKRFPGVPITVASDIENVIASAHCSGDCIAAICGTGSVVFAKNRTGLHRIGGYGYLFDGAGSGYDLGRDALTACFEADDGLRPDSPLTRLVRRTLNGRPWEKLDQLYTGGKNEIAAFAPLVFEALRQGDESAREILEQNLARMVRMIRHAKSRFGCGEEVICAGSIAKQEEFASFLRNYGITPVIPSQAPVYGACLRCIEQYGTATEDFSETFMASFRNNR